MLVRYSIVELLMVFEVSAQREHTIDCGNSYLQKLDTIVFLIMWEFKYLCIVSVF